jgi:hypothetical protein
VNAKTKAQEMAEKAARVAQRSAAKTAPAAPAGGDQAVPVAAPAPLPQAANPQTKPVRSTVDLSPTVHDELDAWQAAVKSEIAARRVTRQDVFRAAADLILNNPQVAALVRDQIRRDKASG